MDEAAKTVGSIVPLVRDFVSWLVARHREDKKRRLLAQEALGKHPILDDSCLPDYPNPPWPTILGKYGDCRGKGALRTWFADMSFAGNEGSRGSVVLLFLWIIAQSHPGTDSNGIHRLLSEVVKSGSERISDKKIDLHDNDFFKKPVKALAKSMQKCPLPDVLVKDLEDLLVNNPTNYKTLQSDFRQSFPRKRPLGFAAGPNAAGSSFAPSLLFNKQGSVIIPCDADAGKLILWATLKLGLGSLVKNESEFDPDRLWNVFYFRSSSIIRFHHAVRRGSDELGRQIRLPKSRENFEFFNKFKRPNRFR
ncbi:hypothetical protein DFH11DRAFT_853313 [Phellopilus nigrolimitatus]|nr:hypothetical protein DFH11DRAFT_853313 [Phellopilus nigrolimitatus]